ncbi:hypothetical protein [Magnetospirillum molischianum]|uniref:Uncharacterized protein n=1 Tax=Magnetospirillum molischianum DSM 120 TaxID=1150626 RepID=H8FXZ2_MAGML|nr:hypothetical protein [Magnetospirillum molischianum]CCG43230.1 exported hypothetical protein [Magnetospirillum molischianum DSM 120]
MKKFVFTFSLAMLAVTAGSAFAASDFERATALSALAEDFANSKCQTAGYNDGSKNLPVTEVFSVAQDGTINDQESGGYTRYVVVKNPCYREPNAAHSSHD